MVYLFIYYAGHCSAHNPKMDYSENIQGVTCKCLDEKKEEQIGRLFFLKEELTQKAVLKIIGDDLWATGHVHDASVYRVFLSNVVQIM